MIAQGGVLSIKEDRLVFAPRALERAVGYADTVIPYDKIKMVEVVGTITESLVVRTVEKAHRFVGGDHYKVRDRINAAIDAYQPTPAQAAAAHAAPQPAPTAPAVQAAPRISSGSTISPAQAIKAPASQCKNCSQPVRSEFHFCPNCRAMLHPTCPKCFRTVETAWKYCAICGGELSPPV